MFNWRITKYNPQYRDAQGIFLKNEWTSYSDIETTINSIKLTFDEYAQIENLYINTIHSFMKCHNITSLQVINLEKPKQIDPDIHDTSTMLNLFKTIKEKSWVHRDEIDDFCKLILRDKLWCKLINDKKMLVHFGWDFYMYIASSLECTETISAIQKNGLFVEPFESPYEK